MAGTGNDVLPPASGVDALIAELRAELKPEVHPERLDAIVLEAAKEPEKPKK